MADATLSSLSSHYNTLPQWAAMVKKLVLIQPGSAAAERLLSLLSSLSLQQESAWKITSRHLNRLTTLQQYVKGQELERARSISTYFVRN